jgi:hypothetical protein
LVSDRMSAAAARMTGVDVLTIPSRPLKYPLRGSSLRKGETLI